MDGHCMFILILSLFLIHGLAEIFSRDLVLDENCLQFVNSLGVFNPNLSKLKKDKDAGLKNAYEFFHQVLLYWNSEASSNASIEHLIECLKDLNFNKAADLVELKFGSIKSPRKENKILETDWPFKTLGILGHGSFGVVIEAEHRINLDVKYAVKVIPSYQIQSTESVTEQNSEYPLDPKKVREARNWSICDHKNIVKCYYADKFNFPTERLIQILKIENARYNISEMQCLLQSIAMSKINNTQISGIFIVSEICAETLRDWLNDHIDAKIDYDFAALMSQDIIAGVNHLHSKNIIHRDLRPENIYFSKDNYCVPVKIGDFGLSIRSTLEHSRNTNTLKIGNWIYRAPEINQIHPKQEKNNSSYYGQTVDHYSLGMTISEIFEPANVLKLADKFAYIKQGSTGKIKEEFKQIHDFILKLTNENPSKRYENDSLGKPLEIKWPCTKNEDAREIKKEPNIIQKFIKTYLGPKDQTWRNNIPKLTDDDTINKLVEEMKAYKQYDKEKKIIELVIKKALSNNNWLDIIFQSFPDLLHAKFGKRNYSFIQYSADKNELGATRYFIERGLNVNGQDKYLWTPLHWAAFRGFVKIAKALLEAGADPNIWAIDMWTPLHWAAYNNHVEVGALLLSYHADPNIKNIFGQTAWIIAKEEGKTKFIQLLESHQSKASN